MRAIASVLTLFLFTGCGSAEVEREAPAAPAKAAPAKEAPKAAAPAGDALDVVTLNKDRESHVGGTVEVKGYYLGTTKQGDQVNISVAQVPEIGTKDGLLCVGEAGDGAFDGLVQKQEIRVSGTVSDKAFFGRAMLDGCKIL
jgi:hypothetical protein